MKGNQKTWQMRTFFMAALTLACIAGFSVKNVSAAEHIIEERPKEEKAIVVTDCDYMSEFIYQQGGVASPDDDAVMLLSSEEEEVPGNTEEAKNALVISMENMVEEIDLSRYHISTEEITSVVADAFNENPNLFYATPETISYDENTQLVQNVVVSYDTAEVSLYEEALQRAYEEAITDPFGMDDMQIARALHDWVVQHVSYDHSLTKYTAYDAIVNRNAVCQGYALAYAELLDKAGIENDFCRSTAMNHIWNYVKINGNWYHVDTTWDDPSTGSGSDDRTGYVRHTFFLNSDTKIRQPASGSTDEHHSWTATKICSSTAYDNAWWQEEVSAIFVIDGREYYLKLKSQSYKIQLICRTGNTEKVVYSKNVKWYKWNSSSYYYTAYSSLSYFRGRLYFNDPLNLYVINPGDTTPKTLYTYKSNEGYIYGSLVCDDGETFDRSTYEYMHLLITKNTNGLGKPVYFGLPSEAINNARIVANPSELPYGYTTPAVLSAESYSSIIGTPTYQWYKITRNSDGIATATAISGATGKTYTIPLGLSEGLHSYRVHITKEDVTLPADITIKVGEVKGTITNKNYALSYVYNGEALPIPDSSNFVTNAGAMTFEWYQDDERLTYTPYEAGTYRLHVTAAEVAYATAAECDFTVVIQKRPLKVQPKDATIIYGDTVSEDSSEAFSYDGLLWMHEVNEISYHETKEVTDSGKITVEYVKIYDSWWEEVTHNYEIEYLEGKLVVLPREITVKADDQKIYKGQELVNTKISVTSGSLPNNFYVMEPVLEASTDDVTNHGVITIKELVIKSWGGSSSPLTMHSDATSNFIIKTEPGRLIIEEGGFGTEDLYRIAGQTRYDTSFKIAGAMKELLGKEKFDSIIIASGKNFPDALAGSYLASVKSAPILMTNGNNVATLKEYILNNLKEGGHVYILGGEAAVPDNVYEELVNSVRGIVKRLSGATRYETCLRILREAGVGNTDVIVCTGRGFADSLSASATGLPILLVGKELTDAHRDFLSHLENSDLYIVGGSSAVSEEIEDELNAYGNVFRVAGQTRYETSVAVAETFFNQPTAAVLAYAKNFPDGLCGGPLAYLRTVPLILTATGKEAEAIAYGENEGLHYGAVLGGSGLISNKTAKQIIDANKITEW